MVNVSIAVPAFTSESQTEAAIRTDCASILGPETKLFKLVPLSSVDHEVSEVVAIPSSSLSLAHLEVTLAQRDELQHQLEMAREGMTAMNDELMRLREYLSLNKTQRMKKLEDENRKLQKSLEVEFEKILVLRKEKRENEAKLQAEVALLKSKVSRLEGGARKNSG